jgi:hypothetical protein
MTVRDDERLRALLSPLAAVEPAKRRTRKRRIRIPVVALAAAVFVVGGAALAGGVNPFAGIGAADHPRGTRDIPDPTVERIVRLVNGAAAAMAAHGGRPTLRLIPGSARLIRTLPAAGRVYVLASTSGSLCVVFEHESHDNELNCGAPLGGGRPTTVSESSIDPGVPPIVSGVAQNDVVSVSFMASGRKTTVPVVDNVWVYEGKNSALASLTVHFRNGTRKTLTH